MKEIYLIRHGSIAYPEEIGSQRNDDLALNEQGKDESLEAAVFLKGRGIEALYHSPLRRCVDTAKIIGSELEIPLIVSQEITEWDENESVRDVQVRLNTFWMMLYAQAYEKLAVVSHRDPLRALILGLAGKKLSDIFKPEIFPFAPGVIWLLKPDVEGTSFENVFKPSSG